MATTHRKSENFTRRSKGLDVVFIHQNFPSQYRNIALRYAANPQNRVAAIGNSVMMRQRAAVPGVASFGYSIPSQAGPAGRGEAVKRILLDLRNKKFLPDLIYVHPAWGEATGIRQVFPDATVIAYAEMYHRSDDPCHSFDPEFTPWNRTGMDVANRVLDSSFAEADLLQTPTRFQFAMLPKRFRYKTVILHDGIDTDWFRPARDAVAVLPPDEAVEHPGNTPLPSFVPRRTESLTLTRQDTVITFINRTLEPARGWHIFARALPIIQRMRPEAQVVVIGRTHGGYGPPPPDGGNWRDRQLVEVRERVDLSRTHFVGNVSGRTIRDLLRISSAHVYLTYPFFVSYSPLEALSCETPLIVSGTAPILEMVKEGENAVAVDFFSPEAVALAVTRLLSDRVFAGELGKKGRKMVLDRYDARRMALPSWEKAAARLLAKKGEMNHVH